MVFNIFSHSCVIRISYYPIIQFTASKRAFLHSRFLPPAYRVRREGYILTHVCLSVHRGGVSQLTQPGGSGPAGGEGGVRSSQGGQVQPGGSGPARGVSGPAGGGSLHGGRYASCVHAGGLSCCK